MAATCSVPAVPPLWTPKAPGFYEQEVGYVGKELTDQAYPIKSFYDAGANVVFHSDYPVSSLMDIKLSIYTAEKRNYPKEVLGGITSPRNEKVAQANIVATIVDGEVVYKA